MPGYKIILEIMVNFVSDDKDVWFSLSMFCFTDESLYPLATDTKGDMMSEICFKIVQEAEGRG